MTVLSHRSLRWLALAAAIAAPAFAQGVRRVAPEQINGYWILLNHTVDADVPNGGRNLSAPGCAAVSYLIGADGVPQDIKVEKSTPSVDFGDIAASAVKRFRYGPSLSNRSSQPVATYYVVPFNSPDQGAGQQKIMAPCRLAGYAAG